MYIRPFAFSSAHSLGISKPSRCLPSLHLQLCSVYHLSQKRCALSTAAQLYAHLIAHQLASSQRVTPALAAVFISLVITAW